MLQPFVLELANAPGTNVTFNLAGPPQGRVGFLSKFSSGALVGYYIDDGTQAEWGDGTVTAGAPDTMTRTRVAGNTAGTTDKLNFTGQVRVYCALPQDRVIFKGADGSVSVPVTGGSDVNQGSIVRILGAPGLADAWIDTYAGRFRVVNSDSTKNNFLENFSIGNGGAAFVRGTAADVQIHRINGDGTETVGPLLPVGGIILWSGAIASIPANWHLCDGTAGTPDLRDRFLVGAGASYGVGAVGGLTQNVLSIAQLPSHSHGVSDPGHAHLINDPGHTHQSNEPIYRNLNPAHTNFGITDDPNGTFDPDNPIITATSGTGISIQGNGTGISIQNTGSGSPVENRPPYYALAYIMRIA